MQRRRFLTLLSSAFLAPLMPLGSARAAAGAVAQTTARGGYSRLLYGFAEYHAQAGGVTTAAELAPRLGVSAGKANALIAKLTKRGVLAPVASSRSTMTRLNKWLETKAKTHIAEAPTPAAQEPLLEAPETDNG